MYPVLLADPLVIMCECAYIRECMLVCVNVAMCD
jgi:hypothetical protein